MNILVLDCTVIIPVVYNSIDLTCMYDAYFYLYHSIDFFIKKNKLKNIYITCTQNILLIKVKIYVKGKWKTKGGL